MDEYKGTPPRHLYDFACPRMRSNSILQQDSLARKGLNPSTLSSIVPSFQKNVSPEKYVDYDKMIRFLAAKHTRRTFDRHLVILCRLTHVYEQGVVCKINVAYTGLDSRGSCPRPI